MHNRLGGVGSLVSLVVALVLMGITQPVAGQLTALEVVPPHLSADEFRPVWTDTDVYVWTAFSFSAPLEGANRGQLWAFRDGAWRLVDASAQPTAGTALAAGGGELYRYGGRVGASAVAGFWRWAEGAWQPLSDSGPGARTGAALGVDRASGRVVLFGGRTGLAPGTPNLGDTWAFAGGTWTQISGTGPSARQNALMAWDAARGRLLLFGGMGEGTTPSDTWELVGNSWERVATGLPILGRIRHVVSDRSTLRVVIDQPDPTPSRMARWSGTAWVVEGEPLSDRSWPIEIDASGQIAYRRSLTQSLSEHVIWSGENAGTVISQFVSGQSYGAVPSPVRLLASFDHGVLFGDGETGKGVVWRDGMGVVADQYEGIGAIAAGLRGATQTPDTSTSPAGDAVLVVAQQCSWMFQNGQWEKTAVDDEVSQACVQMPFFDAKTSNHAIYNNTCIAPGASGFLAGLRDGVWANRFGRRLCCGPIVPQLTLANGPRLHHDRSQNELVVLSDLTGSPFVRYNIVVISENPVTVNNGGDYFRHQQAFGVWASFDPTRRSLLMCVAEGAWSPNADRVARFMQWNELDGWSTVGERSTQWWSIMTMQTEVNRVIYDKSADAHTMFVRGQSATSSAVREIRLQIPSPRFVRQPLDVRAEPGTVIRISGDAVNAESFRWYRGQNALADGDRFSGTSTSVLTISSAAIQDNGDYTLVAINGSGRSLSRRAAVVVPCGLADVVSIGSRPRPDGRLTGDDFNAFIAAFAAGEPVADICGVGGASQPPDGQVTGDDFNAFIAAFAEGCG